VLLHLYSGSLRDQAVREDSEEVDKDEDEAEAVAVAEAVVENFGVQRNWVGRNKAVAAAPACSLRTVELAGIAPYSLACELAS